MCWELINILPSNILQNMLSSGDKDDDNDADARSLVICDDYHNDYVLILIAN